MSGLTNSVLSPAPLEGGRRRSRSRHARRRSRRHVSKSFLSGGHKCTRKHKKGGSRRKSHSRRR